MSSYSKISVFCLLFSALCFLSSVFCLPLSAAEWEEVRGEHFIVHYRDDQAFAGRVLHQAEIYYRRIADDLGYARHSNFWRWENRAKIYIYPTEKSFQEATGQQAWSKGMADYTTRAVSGYVGSKDFLESLLPHEITHLIFRDFIGFEGEVPLWLDEGVAQWQEPKKRAIAKDVARHIIEEGKYYPMKLMSSLDIRYSTDEKNVNYFYMQSVTLVDFLIRRYGTQSFTEFCRHLRDGKTLEEALRDAYWGSIGSLEEFEAKWKKYVLEN